MKNKYMIVKYISTNWWTIQIESQERGQLNISVTWHCIKSFSEQNHTI